MKTPTHTSIRRLRLALLTAAVLAPLHPALADADPRPAPALSAPDIPGYWHHKPFVTVGRSGEATWEASASILLSDLRDVPDRLVYSGRIRYRLGAHHRIGLETVINLSEAVPPRLVLGYDGDIAENWTLRFSLWTTL